jgi:hypothetical protein
MEVVIFNPNHPRSRGRVCHSLHVPKSDYSAFPECAIHLRPSQWISPLLLNVFQIIVNDVWSARFVGMRSSKGTKSTTQYAHTSMEFTDETTQSHVIQSDDDISHTSDWNQIGHNDDGGREIERHPGRESTRYQKIVEFVSTVCQWTLSPLSAVKVWYGMSVVRFGRYTRSLWTRKIDLPPRSRWIRTTTMIMLMMLLMNLILTG